MSEVDYNYKPVTTKLVKPKEHPLTFIIKGIWLSILIIVVVGGAFKTFAENYQIFFDSQEVRCIPEHQLYLIDKASGASEFEPVVRGKIYAYRAKNMLPFFADGVMMGKYALAVEGDHVVVNEHGISVNGKVEITGFALTEKLGVEVEDLYKEYHLGPDEIFFAGTGERSFDSRYWGLGSTSQIFGEAIPLW